MCGLAHGTAVSGPVIQAGCRHLLAVVIHHVVFEMDLTTDPVGGMILRKPCRFSGFSMAGHMKDAALKRCVRA